MTLTFRHFLENTNLGIRYVHKNGQGLMNNNALNYDKLDEDEYAEIEDQYLSLQQPPYSIHDQKVIFVFTPEGEQKHQRLIQLLTKASKIGVKRILLNLEDYNVIWNSIDGQLGLTHK